MMTKKSKYCFSDLLTTKTLAAPFPYVNNKQASKSMPYYLAVACTDILKKGKRKYGTNSVHFCFQSALAPEVALQRTLALNNAL